MGRFAERFLARYADFYTASNISVDPRVAARSADGVFELNLGPAIRALPPGSRVLDLGCATGVLMHWLARQSKLTPVGVDLSESQVRLARQFLPDLEFHHADGLEFLERHRDSFAAIHCSDVMIYLEDRDECFAWFEAAYRALRPGGFFACRVLNAANLTAPYGRALDPLGGRAFTSGSLRAFFETAGFANCSAWSQLTPGLGAALRRGVESALHRTLFRICGRGNERVFSKSMYGIGYRAG